MARWLAFVRGVRSLFRGDLNRETEGAVGSMEEGLEALGITHTKKQGGLACLMGGNGPELEPRVMIGFGALLGIGIYHSMDQPELLR